jgi:hypothetical protein
MELAAAHAGLQAIDAIMENDEVVAPTPTPTPTPTRTPPPKLYTASSYVMSCMTKWLSRWEKTGWITKQRRAVQNGETLRKMAEIAHRRDARFEFVSIVDLIGSRPPSETADSGGSSLSHTVREGMLSVRGLLAECTETPIAAANPVTSSASASDAKADAVDPHYHSHSHSHSHHAETTACAGGGGSSQRQVTNDADAAALHHRLASEGGAESRAESPPKSTGCSKRRNVVCTWTGG